MSTEISVLDHGYVRLVEAWGSDERVIEAARMSTSGAFRGWGPKHDHATCEYEQGLSDECTCTPKPGDEKLLRYLYEHGHTSPFEMAGLVIEVQLPIFVARQWMRHRTWSYNELSARYTEMPDLFYVPSIERLRNGGQAKTNKQASGAELTAGQINEAHGGLFWGTENAREVYAQVLATGLSRELARLVLPVNAYTRMRASANLHNVLAFLRKRLPEDAQWETRRYAEAVGQVVAECFPRTWALFEGGRQ